MHYNSIDDAINRLKSMIKGKVLDSKLDRYMYASDASMYEIIPSCIVVASCIEDVVNTVRFAYEHGIAVTARGGGTGLVGQAIGDGIIIDLSDMNKVIEVNTHDGYVIVEPGVYKGILDRQLKRYNKCIPVDPSSADYCTIGGMIANNASGSHTVKYGSMIDYVLELDVVLADGSILHARKVSIDEIKDASKDSIEVKIARVLYAMLYDKSNIIKNGFPRVSKNSSGYRLDRVLCSDGIDLAKLFVASEGTLGIVVRAKLKIVDIAKYRALALLAFKDTYDACLYTSKIVANLRPSAVELIDKTVIDIVKMSNGNDSLKQYLDADCMLFVEFDGNSREEVEMQMDKLLNDVKNSAGICKCIAYSYNNDEIARIWDVRKNALEYVMKVRKGNSKALAFIEDPVVSVDKLAELVNGLKEIYKRHGIIAYTIYGHAADGNIHTRPMLDIINEHTTAKIHALAEDVFSLVKSMNGSISAEHGDGIARSRFVKMLYPYDIYSLFINIKSILDPKNIMNPGKKIPLEDIRLSSNNGNQYSSYSLTDNLRYLSKDGKDIVLLNWGIRSSRVAECATGYAYELSYKDEVDLCHGCGMCRDLSYKVRMCPVYKGLHTEVASCRGRNNILRWMLKLADASKGSFTPEFTDEYKDIIYKYCIQCKMCLIDCPSNVDVGKIIAEARARYATAHGLPKGYKYFADIDKYANIACKLALLSNALMSNRLFRIMLEYLTGIDARKSIPRFSRIRFDELYSRYRQPMLDKRVAFFADTYIRYINPILGLKIVKILNMNGYRVEYPKQLSSGLPALLEGAIDKGKRIARYNIDNLYSYASDGIPIVTFSPSASLALRMEYLNVIDDEKSRSVAYNTYDIHEFLNMLRKGNELIEFKPVNEDALVHIHCHTLVQGYDKDVIGLLRCIPSLKVSLLERGCCGVGGSYSFIKDNYELSMLIGKELFNAVYDGISNGKRIYTTGESCMLQMDEGLRKIVGNNSNNNNIKGDSIGLTVELIARAYGIED
jgi:FAD/FMN-containing dehydrogenase/Fe-S oxidoreductase